MTEQTINPQVRDKVIVRLPRDGLAMAVVNSLHTRSSGAVLLGLVEGPLSVSIGDWDAERLRYVGPDNEGRSVWIDVEVLG